MTRTASKEKINEALEYLDKVAQEKKEELHRLLNGKYSNIKQAVQEGIVTQLKEGAARGLQIGEDKVREATEKLEKRMQDNPWPVLGGVAVGCLLLGYIFRKVNLE